MAMNIRIRTGITVQATSIGVLWLNFAGVGLARLLKRTTMMTSRTRTSRTMPVMIGRRMLLWKKIWCSRITLAAG